MTLYGGIEAGGTKFVCAVAGADGTIRAKTKFPTTTPEETLARAAAFFVAHAPLSALGIGSFGPVDLHPASPNYGCITTTPKPGWQFVDVVGYFQQRLAVPIRFDTDVNAAALGEHRWGAAQGLHTFIYLTVGTGIGGGAMVEGRLLHGAMHPEMGHMLLPRHPRDEAFEGACPYHPNCLEGLAAGPSLEKRWGQRGETLPAAHPAWELEAYYLGVGLATYVLLFAPQRLILGGGVMAQPRLLEKVRAETRRALNGYMQFPALQAIDSYIVPPQLGADAGILGALALAARPHAEPSPRESGHLSKH